MKIQPTLCELGAISLSILLHTSPLYSAELLPPAEILQENFSEFTTPVSSKSEREKSFLEQEFLEKDRLSEVVFETNQFGYASGKFDVSEARTIAETLNERLDFQTPYLNIKFNKINISRAWHGLYYNYYLKGGVCSAMTLHFLENYVALYNEFVKDGDEKKFIEALKKIGDQFSESDKSQQKHLRSVQAALNSIEFPEAKKIRKTLGKFNERWPEKSKDRYKQSRGFWPHSNLDCE